MDMKLSKDSVKTLNELFGDNISNLTVETLFKNTEECEKYNKLEYLKQYSEKEYKYDFPILKICKYSNNIELIKYCLILVSKTEECKFYTEEIIIAFSENDLIKNNIKLWRDVMCCLTPI